MTLSARGYSLTLQVATDQKAETESCRRLAGEGRVDGVFLTDVRGNDRRFYLIRELGLPAVAMGPPAPDCPFPSVAVDDSLGVRDAVSYLAGLGHGRIGYVHGTPGYVHTVSTYAAWKTALVHAGLEPGPVEGGDFTGLGGASATCRVMALPDPLTAIVYANDHHGDLGNRGCAHIRVARARGLVRHRIRQRPTRHPRVATSDYGAPRGCPVGARSRRRLVAVVEKDAIPSRCSRHQTPRAQVRRPPRPTGKV